jgi:HSP20 family protein
MALQLWTPALELSELRHQFEDVLERHFGHPAIRHLTSSTRSTPLEYYREGDKLVVQVDLPGVDPKNIEVTLSGDVLHIAGERKDERHEKERDLVLTEVAYGRFERSLRVPPGLENDQIAATYDKGILKLVISLPKAMEPRKVPVHTITVASDVKPAKKPA